MKDDIRKMLLEQGWEWDRKESSFYKETGQYSREDPPCAYLASIQVGEYGEVTVCDDALAILLGEVEVTREMRQALKELKQYAWVDDDGKVNIALPGIKTDDVGTYIESAVLGCPTLAKLLREVEE